MVAGLRAESMLWELTDAFAGGGSYRWGCGRGHAAEKKAGGFTLIENSSLTICNDEKREVNTRCFATPRPGPQGAARLGSVTQGSCPC